MSTAPTILILLNDLIQICRDGWEGFKNAAEDLKSGELKSLLLAYSAQRGEFAEELRTVAHALGEHHPPDSGRMSGALHRGWLNLKAALADNDRHAVLVECERSEHAAVETYYKAVQGYDLPANIRQIIERQFVAIKSVHDRIKELAGASAK